MYPPSSIIIDALLECFPEHATERIIWQFRILLGTSYAVTAATSIFATLTIAYRIYYLTSRFANKKARGNYRYIIEIMVQSASVYTALMLGQAVCGFLTANASDTSPALYLANCYLNALGVIASVSSIQAHLCHQVLIFL